MACSNKFLTGLKILLNSDIFLTLIEGGIGKAIARNVIPFHNCEITTFTKKLQNVKGYQIKWTSTLSGHDISAFRRLFLQSCVFL